MSEGTELKLVTFDRTSAKDLLQKLHREIERIGASPECDVARDHVSNAFLTAWHLHEWLWNAVIERPELKATVLKYRGIDETTIDDQKAFGAALAGRFVPLKICRIIATSSKLVQVVLPSESDARSLSAEIPGIGESLNGERHPLSAVTSTSTQFIPMIVVMGRSVAASRILREIEDYWITLIHECGVEQLQ